MYLTTEEVTKDTARNIITLLKKFVYLRSTGHLQINFKDIQWSIYWQQGNIIYISNSLKPEEKFERHLRFFTKYNPGITSAILAKTRLLLFKSSKQGNYNPEYEVIRWLYQEKIFSSSQIYNLIYRLTQEALESLLLLPENEYVSSWKQSSENQEILTRFLLDDLLAKTEDRLKKWQQFTPEITSSYQVPYLAYEATGKEKLLEEIKQKYGKILSGYSFRELGARSGQDELIIAQKLYPLICEGLIELDSPPTPFDKLPTFLIPITAAPETREKIIVCVDDSSTVVKIISYYLSSLPVKIHALTESTKALMEIMRLKPDLILLDIGMPDLDGYRLCNLIRNNSALSQIPVIMVTGKNKLIDRAKAKLVGATDYLTKPFGQDQLNEIVLKYL